MSARSASTASSATAAASFSTGTRLAGERRLVHAQVAGAEEAQVGGHLVAGLHQHEVAGHEVRGRQAQLLPGPQHRRLGRHRPAERVDGRDGLGLLQVADDGVEEHDAEDDDGVHVLLEEDRHHARRR